MRKLFLVTALSSLFMVVGCSSTVPDCGGSAKPATALPNSLKDIGIPLDETAKVCESINTAENEFIVSLSHANNGSAFDLFEEYKTKFSQKEFKRATSENTEELIRNAEPNATSITEYFFKDDLMIMLKIEPDIVKSGLKKVTLRDVSGKLIAKDFDLDSEKKQLKERFAMFTKKLDKINSSNIPKMKKEMLKEKTVLFQIDGSFAENFSKYEKDEIFQLSKKHNKAGIIAFVKTDKNPEKEKEYDPEKDGRREVFDSNTGRTTTYFKGGYRSGVVYFLDKDTGNILGKRAISAENSLQVGDEGKDLRNNYYREIEKLEREFGAINRSIK